jgi:hypothetical protein
VGRGYVYTHTPPPGSMPGAPPALRHHAQGRAVSGWRVLVRMTANGARHGHGWAAFGARFADAIAGQIGLYCRGEQTGTGTCKVLLHVPIETGHMSRSVRPPIIMRTDMYRYVPIRQIGTDRDTPILMGVRCLDLCVRAGRLWSGFAGPSGRLGRAGWDGGTWMDGGSKSPPPSFSV